MRIDFIEIDFHLIAVDGERFDYLLSVYSR